MSDLASSLPIRTELNGDVVTKLCDGTTVAQTLAIDVSGAASVKMKNGLTDPAAIEVVVAGAAIDPRAIRALTSTDVVTANIKDSAGASITVGQKAMAASLPVTIASDQTPIPVIMSAGVFGTEVNDYNTAAAVAANASSNHDYSITALKTLKIEKIWASASGKIKIEAQVSSNGTLFTTKFVGFNSTSNPNIDIDLSNMLLSDTGAGSKIRIIRTNLDKSAQDVYSTISGVEV
jgi:hypothetical protein